MPISSRILLTVFLGIIILIVGSITKRKFVIITSVAFILFSLATTVVLFFTLNYM
jgi:hypothetical protein